MTNKTVNNRKPFFIALLCAIAFIISITAAVSFAGAGMTAYATASKCSESSCTGEYDNGFCTVCGGYQAATLTTDKYDVDDNGTKDRVYEIGNAGQLYWFAALVNGTLTDTPKNESANAVLTKNIVVNQSVLKTDGTLNGDGNNFLVWTPIGYYNDASDQSSFKGIFDGAGHTISGLFFNNEAVSNVGFIGSTSNIMVGKGATVKNVGIIDSYINADSKVGGLVGHNNNYSLVENCYSTGTVSGNSKVGGLIGYNEYRSSIKNSYNTGNVFGNTSVGGVTGDVWMIGVIRNCFYLTDCAKDSNNIAQYGIGSLTEDSENFTTVKTSAQFASGEVAYLLNGTVAESAPYGWTAGATDGTQTWYQNLGEDGDASPVLDNTHGTVYIRCDSTTDSTVYANTAHRYNRNDFCTFCEGYQPATLTTDKYDVDGDGTKDNVYEIENAGQLYWFAALVNGTITDVPQNESANAILTADITVNENVLNKNGNLNGDESNFLVWTPIGYYNSSSDSSIFRGVFDGAGHTISGLFYNNTNVSDVGFIGGTAGATVKNLGIIDSYINAGSNVGGVVGKNEGTVTNCYNTGMVLGGVYVGGVVGKNEGTVSDCYNTGTVSGSGNVGGVVGYSYAYGAGAVLNCYNTGVVSGDAYVGSVVGYIDGNSIVSDCYYLADSETDKINGTTFKTAEQFASGEVAYLLNGSKSTPAAGESLAWYQNLGEGGDAYPVLDGTHGVVYIRCDSTADSTVYANAVHDYNQNGFCTVCNGYQAATLTTDKYDVDNNGTKDSVYEIENAGQLYWFAALVNGTLTDGTPQNLTANAVLTADIVLNTGYTFTFNADTGLVQLNKASETVCYIGTGAKGDASGENESFDTQASVRGTLYRNETGDVISDTDYLSELRVWSAIGNIDNKYNGVFDGNDHTVSGIYINTETDYQGLFGFLNTAAEIKNVGIINSFVCGKNNVGGVAGVVSGASNATTKITNCYNRGTVSGNSSVGGVVGGNGGSVSNCYNTSAVSGNSSVGGVVGRNSGGTVSDCYNTGTVSGSGNVGGVVGYSYAYGAGAVLNCYNTGAVSGSSYVGGVVGKNDAHITNCYNTGIVGGGSFVGGVVGNNYIHGTISNCYNCAAVSGNNDAVGGVVGFNDGTVSVCYNAGVVSGDTYVGSVVGYIDGNSIVSNCYYLADSETDSIDGTTFKTAEQFASGEVAYLLNGSKSTPAAGESLAWYQNLGKSGDAYPVLDGTHGTVFSVVFVLDNENVNTYQNGTIDTSSIDRTGYTTECYTDATFSPDSKVSAVTQDMSLYVKFTPIEYTITFVNEDGATVIGTPQTKHYGETVTAPDAPAKEGYRFDGWTPEITTVTGNKTYTAIYVKLYTVTVAGGSIEGETDTEITVDENGNVTVMANAVDGKTFTGWRNASGEIVSTDAIYTFSANADMALTAVYEDVIAPTPEPNGLSGGAIAGIAVGSVAVAGLGGFAIFWFVIKKKSLADLLAVFKRK